MNLPVLRTSPRCSLVAIGLVILAQVTVVRAETTAPAAPVAPAATSSAPAKDDPLTSPRTRWWREAKYGMFIHWGVYSVPAGIYQDKETKGLGEWIMNNAKIPIPEYEKFTAEFNPVKFDAKEWARVAKAAGMKYMVITSKHHDGFCMFDTKATDYNIVKATPYKRDPMKDLAAACKDAGIRFGFYHSIMDWHHPDANPNGAAKYIPHMKEQLRELVVGYDPAVLWFDGEWVGWWDQAKGTDLEAYCRGLKDDIIINNRVGKRKMTDGDYETPEQRIPAGAMGKRLWETCMTLNNTWGFRKNDHAWKKPDDVVRKLSDIASKGGNFLLNVGPDAEGVIPAESVKILEDAGAWVAENGEAIYGTTFATLAQPTWGRITRKDDRLFLIVFNWPKEGESLRLAMPNAVKKASLLKGGSSVPFQAKDGEVSFTLPAAAPSKYASVVVVRFEGELPAFKSLADRTAAGEPIVCVSDGPTVLPAAAAKLHGQTIQLEGDSDQANVGFWMKQQDYVEWFVQAKEPGKFRVELTYSCADGYGGDFAVTVADQKLTGKTEPTGDWGKYKTVNLGEAALPKEKVSVTVKPEGAFTKALMNMRSVKLSPRK